MNGVDWYAMEPHAETPATEHSQSDANFHQYMPGYENSISEVNHNNPDSGQFEVRHSDGSGTAFYDTTMYQSPKGDYQVYEDMNGGQWYAIGGAAGVDRVPVYDKGKPVYSDGELVTKNVETVKYKTTLTPFDPPTPRDPNERVVPRRRT